MRTVLLAILSSIILLYIPLNRQVSRYSFKIKLDEKIPLIPWTVWVYSSYYILFLISFLFLWNTPYIIPYLATQIIATATSSFIWKMFPNGVSRPVITGPSHSHVVLRFLYSHDRDCNGLPSGHVLHTFIACFFLAVIFPQSWFYLSVTLLLISLSTLTTKQHYLIDIITTLLISPMVIEITRMFL